MDNYSLNVDSPIKGGYFSSEQIDLIIYNTMSVN